MRSTFSSTVPATQPSITSLPARQTTEEATPFLHVVNAAYTPRALTLVIGGFLSLAWIVLTSLRSGKVPPGIGNTMKLTTILLAGAAMFAATGAQAQTAGTYDFSYLFASTGNTVSGVLTGSLEANKNIFDITGVKSYAVNGEATMDMLNVGSSDQFYGTGNGPAIGTLDSSSLNFYIDNSGPSDIFTANVGNGVSNAFGQPVIGATTNYGGSNDFDPYVQANYKASFVPAVTTGAGAVPEPATWAMMMVGFGMIGFGLRRRNKVTTSVRFA